MACSTSIPRRSQSSSLRNSVRYIPSFAYGHVIAALLVGVVFGATLLNVSAIIALGTVLAAAAVISALICWWWLGFEAPSWKLWLVATVANPLLIGGVAWSLYYADCLAGETKGWDCLFADMGWLAVAATLPSPVIGLIARFFWTRRRKA